MADKRMFSKSIIGSARFLRMPPSSRLLYYDLGMYADDDGIVEAFSVMRQTNATEDDLRVLVTKGFVTILNDDLVSYITDWKTNNFIRKDRYRPSIYKELILRLSSGQPNDNQMTTNGIPRLGKDRLGKDRIDKSIVQDEFEKLWTIYPKKQGKQNAYKAYEKARKDGVTYEDVEKGIKAYVEYCRGKDAQYIKMGSSFFNQRAWQDDWSINGRTSNYEYGDEPSEIRFGETEGWSNIFGN